MVRGLIFQLRSFCSRVDVATLFALSATIVGLGYVIFTPPFQGWDETEHFYRSYQVSELNVRAERMVAPNASGLSELSGEGYGGYLPKDVIYTVRDLRFNENEKGVYDFSALIKSNNNSTNYIVKEAVRFDNTAIYSPAGYIPQAFGVSVAKLFGVSPIAMLYIARIFGLVSWIAILYLSIRFLPAGKRIYLVLALNPVAIFLAATLSPDAIAGAVIALLVAVIMRMRLKGNTISKKTIVAVILMTLLVVLIKNIYLPVALLLLLIPKKVLSRPITIIAILISICASLFWNASILHMTQSIPGYFGIPWHIDAKAQIDFILHEPIKFIAILMWNLFGTNSIIINTTYNGVFVANALPAWSILAWVLAFTYAIFTHQPKEREELLINGAYDMPSRRLSLFVFTATVVLIVVSLYIGWSAVGDKDIVGVQGRYFIPLSFLLVPVLVHKKIQIFKPSRKIDMIVFSVLGLSLLATLASLIVRYNVGV